MRKDQGEDLWPAGAEIENGLPQSEAPRNDLILILQITHKKTCKKCKKLGPVAAQGVQNRIIKTEIHLFCTK